MSGCCFAYELYKMGLFIPAQKRGCQHPRVFSFPLPFDTNVCVSVQQEPISLKEDLVSECGMRVPKTPRRQFYKRTQIAPLKGNLTKSKYADCSRHTICISDLP